MAAALSANEKELLITLLGRLQLHLAAQSDDLTVAE